MLTDSHCHLASHRYGEEERPELIGQAMANGVGRMVTLSTCLDDLQTNLDLADHPAVHAAIGIHPCDVHQAPDDAVAQLAAHVQDPRICAIGETGLDYFHPAPEAWLEEDFRGRQRQFLRQHFELAAEAGLGVVIHTRDRKGQASFEDALAIFREHHQRVRAVFHCFVGPWENARMVLDLGGLVSFGGVATFSNARDVLDCACRCPAGGFMLETDSPYLAPVPHRGERNQPAWLRDAAAHIAAARSESLEELAAHTNRAADGFFRFR